MSAAINPKKRALIASLIQSPPEKIETKLDTIDQEIDSLGNLLNNLGEKMKAVGNTPEAIAPIETELVEAKTKIQDLESQQATIKKYLTTINDLEKQILIKSIKRKLEKKDFFLQEFDNASDAEIKFSLTAKIDQLDQQIKEMMEQLEI